METTTVTVFCAAALTADYDHNVLAPAERAAFKAAANARNLPEAMDEVDQVEARTVAKIVAWLRVSKCQEYQVAANIIERGDWKADDR